MGSRRYLPFLALAVCVLLSFTFGARRSWKNVTVDATAPPDVCRLIRPETIDILAPGHGALESKHKGGVGVSSSWCGTEGLSPVDGSPVGFEVGLHHRGRHEGKGPRCAERLEEEFYLRFSADKGQLPLGDQATYFIEHEQDTGRSHIDLSICLGTYVVYVHYIAAGVPVPRLIDSASTVGLEVLSHRRRDALFPPLQHWPVILGALP